MRRSARRSSSVTMPRSLRSAATPVPKLLRRSSPTSPATRSAQRSRSSISGPVIGDRIAQGGGTESAEHGLALLRALAPVVSE